MEKDVEFYNRESCTEPSQTPSLLLMRGSLKDSLRTKESYKLRDSLCDSYETVFSLKKHIELSQSDTLSKKDGNSSINKEFFPSTDIKMVKNRSSFSGSMISNLSLSYIQPDIKPDNNMFAEYLEEDPGESKSSMSITI